MGLALAKRKSVSVHRTLRFFFWGGVKFLAFVIVLCVFGITLHKEGDTVLANIIAVVAAGVMAWGLYMIHARMRKFFCARSIAKRQNVATKAESTFEKAA